MDPNQIVMIALFIVLIFLSALFSTLFLSPPNNLIKKEEIKFNTATTGLKTIDKNLIKRHTAKVIDSAFLVANDFGVISPKINIINVTNPVAIATPAPSLPKIEITKEVVNDEAAILTKLFPIRIALNRRS